MFSGLVEAKSSVLAVETEEVGLRLRLALPLSFDDVRLGDSIAIQGCCLTVVALTDGTVEFQAGRETLSKTTLGRLRAGANVNLERSLALGDRLGGHLVSGHVDGLGTLLSRGDEAQWSNMVFAVPDGLTGQLASKGSIAVDGVSLTVVDVTDNSFSVALIPHTLEHTTLGELRAGDRVNLETDILAKYVQRQLSHLGNVSLPMAIEKLSG